MFDWTPHNIGIEKDFKISWTAWASFQIRFHVIQLLCLKKKTAGLWVKKTL